MSLVKINHHSVLSKDNRGQTSELLFERSGKVLFAHRKAGSVSGNHYHKGQQEHKNPEVLWIMMGTVLFKYRKITDNQWQEEQLEGPCKIEIFPNVMHVLEGITDFCMIELNSLEEHITDTFRDD
jgi:hypothetical protein